MLKTSSKKLKRNMISRKRITIAATLTFLIISACGLSQSAQNKTITQIALNIYASQTSLALSATPTYTPSPTATFTPTSTSTPTPLPSSTPLPTDTSTPTLDPSIILIDDFSDPDSGWAELTDSGGSIAYEDGALLFTIKAENFSYWTTLNRLFMNVAIEVDAKKIAGSDINNIGVICRYKDMYNYYLFSISSGGYYGFFKQIDGDWGDTSVNNWLFDDKVIKTGLGTNHIKVTCNGDNLRMEVNGTLLIDLNDTDLMSGDVGLYAGTYDTPLVKVQFDNFLLSRP